MDKNWKRALNIALAISLAFVGYRAKGEICGSSEYGGFCLYANCSYWTAVVIGYWFLIRDESRSKGDWLAGVVTTAGIVTLIVLLAPVVVMAPMIPIALTVWALGQNFALTIVLALVVLIVLLNVIKKINSGP